MKKNLIALAVGAAMVMPAVSMAGDVKAYGAVQVEIASVDDGTDSAIGMADNGRGQVGIKASEDLGGGWTGMAKFEFKANTVTNDSDKTGNASLTARDSSVALKKKGFGTIELGRLKSAYKYAGGVKYDPFVATLLEARGRGGMTGAEVIKGSGVNTGANKDLGHKQFHSSAIGYRGKVGPVKIDLTYGPSEDDGSMTFSAMYKQKNMEGFIAMASDGDRTSTTVDGYSVTKIGGAWKGGMHKVSLQYEMLDLGGTSTVDPTVLFLGYQAKMGKNTFVAQMGQFDYDSADGETLDNLTFGVIHKMSKMTRVFAGYSNAEDDTDEETVISIGVRKDFK